MMATMSCQDWYFLIRKVSESGFSPKTARPIFTIFNFGRCNRVVDDIKKDTEVSYFFQIKHTDKLKFNDLTLCLSW
ncbi:hypothetical protein PAJ34TS1_15820 [Paenibacillus azoreducens]